MEQIVKDYQKNYLITNNNETVFDELKDSLRSCKSFIFNVAFISFSGLQLFIKYLDELEEKGIKGKILTSTYLDFTDPKSLRKIMKYPNIELKVYDANTEKGFHNKGYIFEYEDSYKVIIGSSNITAYALKNNIEWNVKTIYKKDSVFITEMFKEFFLVWEDIELFDEEFLNHYSWKYYENLEKRKALIYTKKSLPPVIETPIDDGEIRILTPNAMQQEAMESLAKLRERGETKALVIAATATGKTFMSAFDAKQFKAQRVLFIVHRDVILNSALSSYRAIFGNEVSYSIYSGQKKDTTGDFIFSSNILLSNNLSVFEKDEFDYIVIDEAHHAAAETYQKILNYFTPKFLLGMTASPERGDQLSVFDIFDHNVALEVRLEQAINNNLIVPFHYFGVTDVAEVDLSDVKPDDLSEIASKLMIHSRTQYIIKMMEKYGHDGQYRKGLGFCVNLDHAEFMTNEFNQAGIVSEMISGNTSTEDRQKLFERLKDDDDPLEMLFSVDVLNEGIDIPAVNLVLMLRPTNSPIIFLQQLGRGLRKYEDKEYLTVLDFIANYSRSFLLALALTGNRSREKDSTMVQVKKGFNLGPKRVFIQMDEIIQEQILNQLKQTNFNTLKYLKEEYYSFKQSWLTRQDGQSYIPRYLMDYFGVDKAPDPLRFAKHEDNYIKFLNRVENDSDVEKLAYNIPFMKLYTTLTSYLPIIRPIDFIIYKILLKLKEISIEVLKDEVKRELGYLLEDQFTHSLRYINFELEDRRGLSLKTQFVLVENGKVVLSNEVKTIIENEQCYFYILDIIEYGLLTYYREFSSKNYGYPFLKIDSNYSMADVALAGNLNKKISSFRGQGVTRIDNHYFLFVDLHKEADIQESINYKDKIISQDHMQWESQNITTQASPTGQNMIYHKEKGYFLHMFVRKQKELDNKVLPYEYLGMVDVMSYEGNSPITFQFKFHNPLTYAKYQDFVTKT